MNAHRFIFDSRDTNSVIDTAPREWGAEAAIVNAHRFIFDSRDTNSGERLDILNDREGVWRCRTIFNCTEACPARDPHHQGDRRGEEGDPQRDARHPPATSHHG